MQPCQAWPPAILARIGLALLPKSAHFTSRVCFSRLMTLHMVPVLMMLVPAAFDPGIRSSTVEIQVKARQTLADIYALISRRRTKHSCSDH